MLFTELYINHVFGFLFSPLALEITKVITVSFGWVGPPGMQVEYTPNWIPVALTIEAIPGLKQLSPMPCVNTIGREAAARGAKREAAARGKMNSIFLF